MRNAGFARDWQSAAKDFTGNDRVFEDRVDIGCYECNIPSHVSFLLLR